MDPNIGSGEIKVLWDSRVDGCCFTGTGYQDDPSGSGENVRTESLVLSVIICSGEFKQDE